MAEKVLIDCATGEVDRRPLTAEEESERQAHAQAVADEPDEASPDEDLRDAIESASNLNELKAALLGSGPQARARVAGRPTD